jgi:hypothetical protein
MDRRDIEWEAANWIHLADDKDQLWTPLNTIMKPRVSQKARNSLTVSSSRRTVLYGVCNLCPQFPTGKFELADSCHTYSQAFLRTECESVFTIYLHTKFHVPVWSKVKGKGKVVPVLN